MPEWKILSGTMTTSGEARQFTASWPVVWGDDHTQPIHMIAAERSGGPDDAHMPRRVVGIGPDRRSARRSLDAIISRYDPSGTIVPSR